MQDAFNLVRWGTDSTHFLQRLCGEGEELEEEAREALNIRRVATREYKSLNDIYNYLFLIRFFLLVARNALPVLKV